MGLNPDNAESGPQDTPIRRPSPWTRALQWSARLLFLLALLLFASRVRWKPPLPVPAAAPQQVEAVREVPLQVDWSRERFTRWQSPEDGIEVEYPARYDAARAFGRFTSRDVAGGIVETDVVAFRCGQPRSVIVIATYRAPRPLTWAQWTALAKEPVPPSDGRSPAPFAAELGGSDQTYRELHVEGRPALAVSAKGAVKYPLRGNPRMELWRFESRVMAHGDRAIRITAGVHADHYRSSLPALERVLASFRWSGVGLSRE